MDRYAMFVDAGYLYAAGSVAVFGQPARKRNELCMDCAVCVGTLEDNGKVITGLDSLLRIYWYDGVFSNALSTDQMGLGYTEGVKLRLGLLRLGQQKGVDSRIVTDLTELARKRAISDAVLISGDEDLHIGMEIAQEHGVRVHLLMVEESKVSTLLRRDADSVLELTRAEIGNFLTSVAPYVAPAQAPMALGGPNQYQTVVQRFIASLPANVLAALTYAVQESQSIPEEHDGRLLAQAKAAQNSSLDGNQKTALRRELRSQLGA